MAVTIGSATIEHLVAQPFGYQEADTQYGLTAKKWTIAGLVTPAEWLAVLAVYDEWRDDRILDEASVKSKVVGTTVSFSGNGAGGETWTNVPCWFVAAPVGEQLGSKINLVCAIADAAESLEVLLKQEELGAEGDADLPDLGTITIGSAVITLTKPPDSYGEGPSMALTAGGVHYISGPRVIQRVKNVQGTTDETGWLALRDWYEDSILSTPANGDWFPLSTPEAEAQNKIVGGVVEVEYSVAISIGQVIA